MTQEVQQQRWNDVGLNELSLDWRWIVGMVAAWAMLATFPSTWLGAAFCLLWFFSVRRKWGRREAIISLFLVSCVLANSREPAMQFLKIFRLVGAGLLLIEGLRAFSEKGTEGRRKWMAWGGIVLVGTFVPSLISDHASEGLFQSALIAGMWFVMVILSKVDSDEDKLRRAQSLAHLALVVIFISIVVGFLGWRLAFLEARFRGVFGNPNSISHWWLMFFIFGLSGTTSLYRRKSIGLLVLTGVVLYWGASRGAALACLIALTGWVLLRHCQTAFQKTLVVVLFAILMIGVQYMPLTGIMEMLPEHMVRAENLEDGGGRFHAWEHALGEIMKSPWVGHGGGYEERFFENSARYFSQMNHQGLSHNSWIAFAMNYGIPQAVLLIFGFLIFLGMFRSSYWLIALVPVVLSFSVEGYLTAPMSAVSPAMLFVSGFLGSFERGRSSASNP